MRGIGFAACFAAGAVLAGCATVVRGTTESVVFDSEPAGAEMRSVVFNPCAEEGSCQNDGNEHRVIDRSQPPGPACTTPCTISVPRAQELIVTFSKPGYHPKTVTLGRKIAAAGAVGVAGNVLVGGVVGLAGDAVTGAGTDHEPNPLKVTLEPIATSSAGAKRRG